MARIGAGVPVTLADGRLALVRDARPRDARAVAELVDAVAAEPLVPLVALPGRFGAREWRRRIAAAVADPCALVLVAELDGTLVGDLGLVPDPQPPSAHVAWLGMSVGAPWRGVGVGGALLETAAAWAREHAVVKLALSVFAHNEAAIRFYARHGFVREGLRRAHLRRGDGYHDEVLMARFLTAAP